MDDERFLGSSNPNPNLRGFAVERPPRPPAPEQRSSAQIMERFRAMIREREEDLRAAYGVEEEDDDSLPPPSTGEIVRYYEELLAELTFNSKLVITELTMIADEQREHADGIADAICSRILEVPVDQKLPSLYLLDSIVKNVGHEYMRCFAARLPKVFCEAYNQVSSNSHPAMRHLFGTWSQCFPISVLRKIEDELQFSAPENKRPSGLADVRQSESPSSRPFHGIHVNPKYLETRRQLEHSAAMRVIDSRSDAQTIDFDGEPMESNSSESPKGWSAASPKFHDVEHARGVSSSLQPYMQKSPMQHGDYDLDHTSALPPRPGITRSGSPQTAPVCESYTVGVEGTVPRLKGKGSKHSHSPKVGLRKSVSPSLDMIQRDVSPGKGAEKVSPSHSGIGLGSGRVSGQNDWLERRWPLDDTAQQREGSGRYSLNNGYGKQRELIDAYGDYRGKDIYHERHPKVHKLDVDGINGEAATRNWQSSEEEEYVWEDMSPTLADRSSRSSIQPFRPFTARVGLGRPDDRLLDPGFRRNSWLDHAPQPPVVDPSTIVEDRIPVRHFAHGSMNEKYLDGNVSQNESSRYYQSSHHFQEPGNYGFPQYPHQCISPKSRGIVHQTPFSTSGAIPSFGHKLPGPFDSYSEADLPFGRLPSMHSDGLNVDTSTMDKHLTHRPYSPCAAPIIWPPTHKSQQPPLAPIPPSQKPFKGPFDFVAGHKRAHNGSSNSSLFLPQQKYDIADRKTTNSSKPLYQAPGLIQVNRQSQETVSTQVQPLDSRRNFMQTTVVPHLVPQHLNHAQTQGHSVDMGSDIPKSVFSVASSVGMNSVPSTSLHAHGGILPPLPPGPPPVSSEMGSASQSISAVISSSSANPFSGLIGTLMAQGLISLKPSGESQDSVGIEFNAELLKVRHESAINALYTDLSRQCTTCGLRFKCQEEHSSHMDWHVTKNRISKNRKQKPSRKWFVSAKEWLSGAETLGTDAVPGFLPKEAVSEKKEEIEMAVPADENQNVCALCGEPFEDFYSDETEEWMYKGAVYLNAPSGNVEGLDRSQLGPIVHSKCRSDSAEVFGQA